MGPSNAPRRWSHSCKAGVSVAEVYVRGYESDGAILALMRRSPQYSLKAGFPKRGLGVPGLGGGDRSIHLSSVSRRVRRSPMA